MNSTLAPLWHGPHMQDGATDERGWHRPPSRSVSPRTGTLGAHSHGFATGAEVALPGDGLVMRGEIAIWRGPGPELMALVLREGERAPKGRGPFPSIASRW
jgi:hypothetical protein